MKVQRTPYGLTIAQHSLEIHDHMWRNLEGLPAEYNGPPPRRLSYIQSNSDKRNT